MNILKTSRHAVATALSCATMLVASPAKSEITNLGATTAGGQYSTAGVYANWSTVGQLGGAIGNGGVYRIAGGSLVGTLSETPSDFVVGDATAFATGDVRLNADANGGLLASGFQSPTQDRLWLRADGYMPDEPIHTLRLLLGPVLPGGDGWSLILTTVPCCPVEGSSCDDGSCCPPPRSTSGNPSAVSVPPAMPDPNRVTLALLGQTDGSLLLRGLFLPEPDDEVIVEFLNEGVFTGRRITAGDVGASIRGGGRLIAVDAQPDGLMLTFDQPMQLVSGGSSIAGDRIRWRVIGQAVPCAALAWVGLSGSNLENNSLVLRESLGRFPSQPIIASPTRLGGTRIRVRIHGKAGTLYTLESSDELSSETLWFPDGTMALSNGEVTFLESNPSQTPERFYRVRAD